MPDDEAGELPRAYVVPQDTPAGRSLTEHDVVTYVNARVAPHKKLRGGCVFTDAVPKSASGKLLRYVRASPVPFTTSRKPCCCLCHAFYVCFHHSWRPVQSKPRRRRVQIQRDRERAAAASSGGGK